MKKSFSLGRKNSSSQVSVSDALRGSIHFMIIPTFSKAVRSMPPLLEVFSKTDSAVASAFRSLCSRKYVQSLVSEVFSSEDLAGIPDLIDGVKSVEVGILRFQADGIRVSLDVAVAPDPLAYTEALSGVRHYYSSRITSYVFDSLRVFRSEVEALLSSLPEKSRDSNDVSNILSAFDSCGVDYIYLDMSLISSSASMSTCQDVLRRGNSASEE